MRFVCNHFWSKGKGPATGNAAGLGFWGWEGRWDEDERREGRAERKTHELAKEKS